MPDSSSLINLVGKTDKGIEISATGPEKVESSFSIGNALRNLWYRISGKMDDVKSMRTTLTDMRASTPEKFILSAGFRDPSFMSYTDLKTAVTNVNQFRTDTEFKSSHGLISKKLESGLFTSENGDQMFRTQEGRVINVTQSKEIITQMENTSLQEISSQEGIVKEKSRSLGNDLLELKNKSISRLNKARPEESKKMQPKTETSIPESVEKFDKWVSGQASDIKANLTKAKELFSKGKYEEGANLLSKASVEFSSLQMVLEVATDQLTIAQDGLAGLADANQYTTKYKEKIPPTNLTKEDIFLLENPYFKSDKDSQKVQGLLKEGAWEASSALLILNEIGVLDDKSFRSAQFQLSQEQKDGIRSFANLQKTNDVVITAAQTAEITEDFTGGVVLGSAIPNEKVSKAVLVGQMLGYLIPTGGPYAITRDIFIASGRGELLETVKGFVGGGFINGGNVEVASMRGEMMSYFVFPLASLTREMLHSGTEMVQSGFLEGKAKTATAVVLAISTIGIPEIKF